MKLHRLSIVVLCAASLCVAAFGEDGSHDSSPQSFHAKAAGTCTNKDDFSFTGIAVGFFPGAAFRIHCVVAGNSSYGYYTAQIQAELQVTANSCTAGGATGLEANGKGYIIVLSFADGQTQLFMQSSNNGTECLLPPGTAGPGKGTLTVTGGTGRFAGATGTVAHALNPILLAVSVLPGDGFLSAFTSTYDGQINLK